MRFKPLLVAAALVTAAPLVNAQDGRARQRWPDSTSQQPQRETAPRQSEPRSAPREQSAQREQSRPREGREQARERSTPQRSAPQAQRDDGDRRAEPRDRSGRDDGRAVGRAVPRQGPAPQVRDRDRRDDNRRDRWDSDRRYNGRRVYIYPRTTVYAYYGYPRRYFPFGYGGYGPGYYYYSGSVWYPYSAYDYPYRFNPYRYGYPTGEVRLDIEETFAEVWVDGYYAGIVDDFDGLFQGLVLEEGIYNIEIAAPGYEPLEFDIRIDAGRKITYRGDLLRARR